MNDCQTKQGTKIFPKKYIQLIDTVDATFHKQMFDHLTVSSSERGAG